MDSKVPIEEVTVSKMSIENNVISDEEIAKHKTENDCYIALHGFVLKPDNSLFNEHPGVAILDFAGKDVTEDFEDTGHADAAREWADKYIIGVTENYAEVRKNTEIKVPRNKELKGNKPSIGVFPIIIAVFLAIAAYLYMRYYMQ